MTSMTSMMDWFSTPTKGNEEDTSEASETSDENQGPLVFRRESLSEDDVPVLPERDTMDSLVAEMDEFHDATTASPFSSTKYDGEPAPGPGAMDQHSAHSEAKDGRDPATTERFLQGDRNFDDLAEHFATNIYSSNKGQLRLDIVLDDLQASHPHLLDPDGPRLTVLDAGGGIGQFSAMLAAAGHRIILCDISVVMLDKAKAEFAKLAPDADVTFLHCRVQDLADELSKLDGPAVVPDLILFHAVLEWMTDPLPALHVLRGLLPAGGGGMLSVLFYNRHALQWRYLMHGNFRRAQALQLNDGDGPAAAEVGESPAKGNRRAPRLLPTHPQTPDVVRGWVRGDLGLRELAFSGIRAIHDHMSDKSRDRAEYDELLQAERHFSRLSPFRELSPYIHLLCGGRGRQFSSGAVLSVMREAARRVQMAR